MEPSPFIHWYNPRDVPITHHQIREILVRKPEYVASPHFLRTTSWMASISQDALCKATLSGLSPFIISIIGVVSTEALYMQPHANYSLDINAEPYQTTKFFTHAEYKFSLCPPVQYPIFMDDFKRALNHIRIIHNLMDPRPGEYSWDNETPFIQPLVDESLLFTEHQRVFNWTFPIFRKTGLPARSDSKWDEYRAAINPSYATLLEKAFEDFDIRQLSITRIGGELLKVEDYQSALAGSLVEVQFRLDNVYGQGLSAEPTWIWIIDQGKDN